MPTITRTELLSARFVDFGVAIISAVRSLPRDIAARNVGTQLSRCGTSPAANYAEARDAVSDRDYLFKMQLCLKELRETAVWLGMARGIGCRSVDFGALERECNELTAIVVACVKKVKTRLREERGPNGK